MKVTVTTLGCKSNQYDSAALEDSLLAAGFDLTPFPGPADGVVINTCTVTSKTDSQSRQVIRKARRLNPSAVVVVTGCYAQVSPEDVSAIDGVDYIIGNPDKGSLVEYLRSGRAGAGSAAEGPVTVVSDYRSGTPFTLRARSASGRTRANLKIQEGCDRACSYCIIPRARGVSKSLPIDDVDRELAALVEGGYREVVLTGIHLGGWGADLKPRGSLVDILRLVERKGYPLRVRISSLDPDEVTDELIEVMKSSARVCDHLHLPLQSGDDSIIRRMNRPYTATDFAGRVEKAVTEVPGISVGVDVIAGFPGEGAGEFENTFSLLSDLPVSYFHVFPYSARKGTKAEGLDGRVDPRVIKDRCARLSSLDKAKRADFCGRFVGETVEVLVEGVPDRKTGMARGRSSNYIPVLVEGGGEGLYNELVEVALTGYEGGSMRGVVAEKTPAGTGGL